MAKFKTGIISNISGSMGGTSFSSSPYGNVMRLKPQPTNTRSDAKQNAIAKNINVARLWAKCSPAQIQAWNEFAKDFYRIDKSQNKVLCRPIDLFRKINRNLWEINEPFIFNPPKKVYPTDFASIDVDIEIQTAGSELQTTQSLKDIKVYFKPKISKNTKIIVFVSRMLSYGQNSTKKNFYRKIAWLDSAFLSGDSILDKYLSVYKDIKNDTFKFAFKFKPVSVISGLDIQPTSFIRIPKDINDSLSSLQQKAILSQNLSPANINKPNPKSRQVSK